MSAAAPAPTPLPSPERGARDRGHFSGGLAERVGHGDCQHDLARDQRRFANGRGHLGVGGELLSAGGGGGVVAVAVGCHGRSLGAVPGAVMGLVVFTLGSLGCSMSPSVAALSVARVVQGLSGATVALAAAFSFGRLRAK